MAPSLLHPPSHLSPAQALQLSQQAPAILANSPARISTAPLTSLFTAKESADLWQIYENLLLSCLRTGDTQSAHQCLERLVLRFGHSNEKVMALKGLIKESDAANDAELQQVLKEYEGILEENSTNIPVTKRRIALLRSMGRIPEAVTALIQLLEFLPTDPEAWSELADLYLSQGMYAQAIHALEEVLVMAPNAWNMQARLGEVQYIASESNASPEATQKYLAESLKRFSRSIELCDDYLRGYYGLKLVTSKLLTSPPTTKQVKATNTDEFQLPAPATIEKLNELATEKLSEIVRRFAAGASKWSGYDKEEIAAAKGLLGLDAPQTWR